MNIQRFDAIVRQLSQGGTRRRLLGLFSGTAVGGLMATTFGPDAEAKKKQKKKKSCKKKKCDECQVCQKGKCKPKTDGTACSNGGTCEGGVCIGNGNCPPNQVCEISDLCCPEPVINIGGGVVACAPESALCDCVDGTTFCAYGEGFGDCCAASETCDPIDGCVAS